MATWEARLNAVFGPQGYESCMRRSLQTVILYEANRCIAPALGTLRPFQRKLAYIDMANALVDSLEGVMPHQKAEILWRTGTSKEAMNAETAWKRRKLLNKELENIRVAVAPLLANRTHDQAIDAYIQVQFETVTGNTGPAPPNWQHAHNNAIMCYRLYYRGEEIDPTFPEPNSPKEIYVAAEKPMDLSSPVLPESLANGTALATSIIGNRPVEEPVDGQTVSGLGEQGNEKGINPECRRAILQEVRQHLDLLKEFEGIISEDDLAKRKRELFLAMPAAPPPAPKRTKVLEEEV